MTIEINRPETEALIAHYLKSGEYDSADELVAVAINALRDKRPADETTSLTNGERRKLEGRKSLAELFAESAFKGLNMEFDESEDAKDCGREVSHHLNASSVSAPFLGFQARL